MEQYTVAGFNVLERQMDVHASHFLEASAGTGKTFAIETIALRLLLEGHDLSQILIVTFTRAASLELKTRLRAKIEETFQMLERGEGFPDYLCALVEKSGAKRLLERLEEALSLFEEASIFTIHGFCFQMVREYALDVGISLPQSDEMPGEDVLEGIVKDYFRVGIDPKQLSLSQFQRLTSFYKEALPRVVANAARDPLPICSGRSFEELFGAFVSTISTIEVDSERLLEDLLDQAPLYEKLTDRSKKPKPEIVEKLTEFASLFSKKPLSQPDFDTLLEEGYAPILSMHPSKRLKSRQLTQPLNYPTFLETCHAQLTPLIKEGRNTNALLAHLSAGAQAYLKQVTEREELFFYDDLLRLMEQNLANPPFVKAVLSRFAAVLIDEFQDTDPLQWNIFSSLFLDPSFQGPLYLVGDPKQSIYRFRSADIYTYLKACEEMNTAKHVSLCTNYRSTPSLVHALNALFTKAPEWFPLPRYEKGLSCPEMLPSDLRPDRAFDDGMGSIHFWKGEEFTGHIIHEIIRLHEEKGLPLSSFAVLVRDRYQAEQFRLACESASLPVVMKRSRSLLFSAAFSALKELLEAVFEPSRRSLVNRVLGGPLFGRNHHQLKEESGEHVKLFYMLRHHLETEGLLPFFYELSEETPEWDPLFHSDMEQLVELLVETTDSVETLLPLLEKMKRWDPEDERLKARQVGGENAVQLMTIHVSKGLEFEVVFPMGLLLPSPSPKGLIPDPSHTHLVPFDPTTPAGECYSQEIDAEKMRQLYVALTRAKSRLYLPYVPDKRDNSPLSLFLEKVMQGESLEEWVKRTEGVTLSEIEPIPLPSFSPPKEEPPPALLVPPTFPDVWMHSFSSLATPSPYSLSSPVEEGLPAGAKTGHFLHALLETLSFEKAFRCSSHEELSPLLDLGEFEPWRAQVCQMLYLALHTPLTTFPLSVIDPDLIYKEMPFVYRTNDGSYIQGIIDLLFMHEGKLYVLDWKSNLLADYLQESLKQAMEAHDYLLQAELYREATERYASLFNPPPSFGGTIYLFLRGLDGKTQNGIFFQK